MIFNDRPGTCSKYESLWSRIHKFSYLNGASHTDLKVLLNGYKIGSFKKATESFDSLDEFKIDVLCEILGMGEEDLYLGIPSSYQIDDRRRSVDGNLRYCPVCISKGFHSAAFQVRCLKKCPFHNIKFSDRCPSCNSFVEYKYGDKELKTPYGCACGFTLWDGLFDTNWERSISVEQEDTFKFYLQIKSEKNLYISPSNFIGFCCVSPIKGWSPGCFGCQADEVITTDKVSVNFCFINALIAGNFPSLTRCIKFYTLSPARCKIDTLCCKEISKIRY
ncbi:MAG: hypothetical protein GXP08_00895 [Gammaproteobacteria bacterium]|nr:hypothetical protein [Gammaproteobacteria bacterium]